MKAPNSQKMWTEKKNHNEYINGWACATDQNDDEKLPYVNSKIEKEYKEASVQLKIVHSGLRRKKKLWRQKIYL